jgi:type II restriction/modification system DNA methylase subunit YeeA
MTPTEFVKKWKTVALTERAAAQSHFNDLCALLGHENPITADPKGDWFTFEKGVTKTGGGAGFADVWKRNYFAWEYKKRKSNLEAALLQLVRYASALENPPLHVACDTDRFLIQTAWTNSVSTIYEVRLDELIEPDKLDILHSVFFDPAKLKPSATRAEVTKEAADKFSSIAESLKSRNAPDGIAHFVNQLVFCFFANSIGLLPNGFFPKLLAKANADPEKAQKYFNQLFAAMESGGEFDLTDIAHFNGGLFDGARALPLSSSGVGLLQATASLDWSQIDPTIFGTLFERFLDPDKRAQIGAHYTDPEKIMTIVEPVILRPLLFEWANVRAEIENLLTGAVKPPMRAKQRRRMSAIEAAEEARSRFLERLRSISILDPACGSGNFLYLSLQGVKDIENKVNLECEALGLSPQALLVGPEILHGIEINPFAAELARTTIWIGDIQWRRRNGIYSESPPILRKLDAIEQADALVVVQPDGIVVEKHWPRVDFIVGNPPFLGGKLMRAGLGDRTVEALFHVYRGRVPQEADLVAYWFEKAHEAVVSGAAKRVGLVATNSIRGGANRRVLDKIVAHGRIFEAWSDEPWVVDGAAVRVSMICFSVDDDQARLDGKSVSQINADLTSGELDLTKAKRLDENLGVSYMGDTKGGAFDVPGELARRWLRAPINPNGRPNSEVLRPWRNGQDITRRSADKWIIDFGWEMSEREASYFQVPFEHVKDNVLPERLKNRRDSYRKYWWRHVEPRPAMIKKLRCLDRYIVTPTVAKYRIFEWLSSAVLPDHQLIIIAREDDATFGILHSRFHEAWSLRLGTWLGVGNDPRYTPTTTFETFPFPDGLSPQDSSADHKAEPYARAIATAARRLVELRRKWLNPENLIRIEPEVVSGYPNRELPFDASAATELQKRTLTKLYNEMPQWLIDAHSDLDATVAASYGWPADIPEDVALKELLALNLARSGVSAARHGYSASSSMIEKINAVEGVVLSPSLRQALTDLEEVSEEGRLPPDKLAKRLGQTTR